MEEGRKLHFVIVGGSLGGLATGLALKRLGHDTTILERNPTPLLHDQGAGIVAGGDTLKFFQRYIRCDRPMAVTSHKRIYLNRAGDIIHTEEMDQNMTSWDLVYHLMRANYDYTESDYCETPSPLPGEGKAVHLHDRKVTGVRLHGSGVAVSWESSKSKQGGGQQHEGEIAADYVIGADGPSSTLRGLLEPGVERTYAGYCALRGTVPESEVRVAASEAFCERFTFFHAPGVQILAYLIPGRNGATEPGRRLINFVYYTNFASGEGSLDEVMTDREGRRRHITMPPGMMSPAAWERQRRVAAERLPPQFAEVVRGTKTPFVQAITDVVAPTNEYMGGRVMLVGDALAGFRPHTVASTSQACFDAMMLAGYFAGEVSRGEWKRQTMGFARLIQRRGVDMGTRSQFRDLPVDEYIHDRNVASTPREDEVFPDWATAV